MGKTVKDRFCFRKHRVENVQILDFLAMSICDFTGFDF